MKNSYLKLLLNFLHYIVKLKIFNYVVFFIFFTYHLNFAQYIRYELQNSICHGSEESEEHRSSMTLQENLELAIRKSTSTVGKIVNASNLLKEMQCYEATSELTPRLVLSN